MRALLALLATLPVAASAQGRRARGAPAPITDVRYEVTFDSARAERRAVGVRMTFTTRGNEPVLLSLPAWTPGAYELSYFAKYVVNFSATGDGGRALGWDKVDFDTWRIRDDGPGRGAARQVAVSFDYVADSLDNAMSWARPDFLMFNGTNLFLYPEGQPLDRLGATVRVTTQPAWRVVTGMPRSGAPGAVPNEFTATNYHDLVDMPFFVGRFDVDSVQASGRWARLATYPVGSIAGERRRVALDWIRRVIPPQVAVFGDVPWGTYTVMQIVDSAYGGASGLEHQNSHVDIIAAGAIDNEFIPSLYAHEIFHAWNVKRLRPAELVPYRYDREQPTPLLWVSEGITDYYADLSELRGGVFDSAGFFAATTGKINNVAMAPPVALEDASLSTWVHPVDGTGYLYYDKGSLAGLALDILIRDGSDNARSLDTVMRELYEQTYKRGGAGFTTEQFLAAAQRAAGGRDLGDFYRRYIDGREPYPWATVLPLAGMRLRADTVREARLGVNTFQDSAGVFVGGVLPGSTAAVAGVRPGDYLLGVGEVEVRDNNFSAQFRRQYAAREGAPITLRVRRGDQTLTLPASVRLVSRVEQSVGSDRAPTPKALRIRNGIFRGVTGQ